MTPEHDSHNATLQAKVELLELRIQDKEDQIRELREERIWLRFPRTRGDRPMAMRWIAC